MSKTEDWTKFQLPIQKYTLPVYIEELSSIHAKRI